MRTVDERRAAVLGMHSNVILKDFDPLHIHRLTSITMDFAHGEVGD